MVPDGGREDSKGERQPIVIFNYNEYEPKQLAAWHNNPKKCNGCMKIFVVTNSTFIGLKMFMKISIKFFESVLKLLFGP